MNYHSVLLIACVGIAFLPIFLKRKEGYTLNGIQDTVSTAGILVTFLGIVIGISQVDMTHIEEGIPLLLSALKYGFVASIISFGVSIVVKVFPNWYGLTERSTHNSERGILMEISESLKKLNNSIAGENDSTLITQVQKMRVDLVDSTQELNKSFKEFADKVTENNSKALIEALEGVMRDFNTKINEQFGDNFKQLNQAVGNMLVWQENYKSSVERNEKLLEEIRTSIDTSKNALAEVAVSSAKTSENSKTMISVAESAGLVISKLQEDLNQFNDVSRNVKVAFEAIEKSMSGLRDSFVDSSNQIIKENQDSVNKMRIELTEASRTLKEQTVDLDRQLGEELTKSLTTLGSQLTSLSGKFVEDYSNLATRLSEIMKLMNK